MDGKLSLKVTSTIQILLGINHISGTAEARIVKFCMQVDCVKSIVYGDKPLLKGRGQSHVTRYLNFALIISL